MKKRKMKISWRKVLSFALAILLLCGAVAGVSALVEHFDDDMKTIHPTFKRGALDIYGAVTSDKGALYTPEAFKADGLEVNLDPESHLSYRVFYYTADNEYLGCSELFTKSGKPYFAAGVYARVVLYPVWDQLDDDDEKISWYQVWGYASDVELRVLKDGYKYEKISLTKEDCFSSVSHYVDNDGSTGFDYSHYVFSNGQNYVDSIYFEMENGAKQDISEVSVGLTVGDKHYYFSNVEMPGEYEGGWSAELPTKENPLYVPKGYRVVFDVYTGITDCNELVFCVHRAPKE